MQLKITSKVKADVQNISGELIVSGLDSATSLIQVGPFVYLRLVIIYVICSGLTITHLVLYR